MFVYNRRNWWQVLHLKGTLLPLIMDKVGLFAGIAVAETWLIRWEHITPLPLEPFTVLGIALGLLLTLRTNASYDRFWEGRKAWGMIVNRSRNLVRQAVILTKNPELGRKIAELVAQFSEASERQLRGKKAERFDDSAQGILQQLGAWFDKIRREGLIDSMDLLRLEGDLAVLIDQIGICERIQSTPIPMAYTLHLRVFLIVYCLALPLALAENLQWFTPFVVAFIAFAFLGIEQIGVEIEDPFEVGPNHLDLEGISRKIRRDVTTIAATSPD